MYCPCHSKKAYTLCCAPCHRGISLPLHAVDLMRSRYSAYALGKADYIIETTHTDHPDQAIPLSTRKKQILSFCRQTRFIGLEIVEKEVHLPYATVTFHAHLQQKGKQVSFIEKSEFKREEKWLYRRSLSLSPAGDQV